MKLKVLNWNPIVKLRFLRIYCQEFSRLVQYSSVFKTETKRKLSSRIVRQAHIIEKGLSLRNKRSAALLRFRIEPFTEDVEVYYQLYGYDYTVENALIALSHLERFLSTSSDYISKRIILKNKLKSSPIESLYYSKHNKSATKKLSKSRLFGASRKDLEEFFRSRHSIRQFSSREVDYTLIEQALEIAAYATPSACNRQPWRVYALCSQELKKEALELQGGSAGFGDEANIVLVLTGELNSVLHVGERHQPWLDGGMFAMSTVLALHSLGLGSCCLNWSKTPKSDVKLRRLVGISESEVILMLIAVGHIPENFEVATSRRQETGSFLSFRY